ncbi:F-box protein MAX2-like [Melia azedarach]|uniref:F-box protein MAX2-like n=2 Tax=Melia azedarach TaxID=155640 RepID=A0ACC1WWP2_MELAZ|nr:F-box protein MAX2-like [Melia azedarach]KAJ4703656.1 F-box protein MAX2-like [Melia azedarach]
MAGTLSNVHFHDIPDALLSHIFSLVTDTRTRNAISLVCQKWCKLERSTRTSLTLRGNIRDLYLIPDCFQAVTNLDLSFISPWGHPLLDSSSNPLLLAKIIGKAFPSVVSLTIYARNPLTLHFLAPEWPNLCHVKLVRWHQRPNAPLGSDFHSLFGYCHSLSSLDLSQFYCWTEDLPPALEAYPTVAVSLTHLNILTHFSAEGCKSHELLAITAACPNLRQLLATCIFDHRFIGFVGDNTLLSMASNCPRLSLLHLVDSTSLSNARADPTDERNPTEDARISHTALGDFFTALPWLEDLVLDVCNNVRDSWSVLELLNSKCPRLKSLKLGHFHGICRGIDSRPDGVALCRGLESLSIKNSADLTDCGLIAISLGCSNLTKFEVQGCERITEMGVWKLARILRRTLVDVRISSCKNLNTVCSLQALEPIRDRIQRLHIDCSWETVKQSEGETSSSSEPAGFKDFQTEKRMVMLKEAGSKKKSKYYNGNGKGNSFSSSSTWANLQYLSLWIAVGDLLTPIRLAGLENCPILEEIHIKVVGDCRYQQKPYSMAEFGLNSLVNYPQLSKMHLDCGEAIGFALTAPRGHADLSLWERFYLNGIPNLNLRELNYWPPQDMDVNQRSISLPAAGLLAQCRNLRKLFIHGTANEHFMMFFLKIQALRDVQLREDYYPAPEIDTSTEMRVDSCCRFEDALNRRQIPD